MFHVIRSADGTIESVSKQLQPGSEMLSLHDPEIQLFFNASAPKPVLPAFNTADAELVRVIEDLIDTLIMKNVIRHTDLPDAAQRKLMIRKGLRNRMQGALDLLGGDESIL